MTFRQWRRLAEGVAAEHGAVIDWERKGHPRVTLPNGRTLNIARSPAKPTQSAANFRTRLRRKA